MDNQISYKHLPPVVIAGAGPTGLLLGILLAQKNIPFVVIEPRLHASRHSRSIGIHPPSLSVFNDAGIADAFLQQGNKITEGKAFVGNRLAGSIPFSKLDHPFPFILTLSQQLTESILEEHLLNLAPESLKRGLSVVRLHDHKDAGSIQAELSSGETLEASRVIGCDGKDSTVRRLSGIDFKGGTYPDTYIMGDFEDNTGSPHEARVFLCSDGLVESFPHSSGLRRWVIKTSKPEEKPDPVWLATEAKKRTGTAPDALTNSMISSFGVQRFLAESFFHQRVILAGDAAHVVSPIGGQGMNLGWFDAALLAGLLPDILHPEKPRPKLIHSYEYRRKRAAYTAAQRAEFNMRMGREFSSFTQGIKKIIVRAMLLPPVRGKLLKSFTMHGLD